MTFLIERTGERLSCLLNPESLEVRRQPGLRRRTGAGGGLFGPARSDDPLVATGGGVTEYDLRLLFDVEVAREGATRPAGGRPAGPGDVRELTRPLWDLSENGLDAKGPVGPPQIRLIWGKSWNVLGVVAAVAERLERFDPNGAPQRSWLSLRLRRVEASEAPRPRAGPISPQFEQPGRGDAGWDAGAFEPAPAPIGPDGQPTLRLDIIAADVLGDPARARELATLNDLDDMLSLPENVLLLVPGRRSQAGPAS